MSSGSSSRAVEVVKASLDPQNLVTAPPMLDAQSAFSKTIDLSGNFTVNDVGLVQEAVPTSTGFVADFVARGVASTYRFGIVPAGAQSAAVPIVQWAGVTPGVTIKYVYPMPVPYYDDGNNQIKVGPDLSQNFSMTRKYSGVLTVISDTVPIGNTALNGYLSAASIADTRDVAQIIGVSPSSFDSTTLVQTCVTAKDGIKEISVMRGVTSLVGPDIPFHLSAPDVDAITHLEGAQKTIPTKYVDKNAPLPGAGDFTWPLYNCFLSPWGVQMQGLGTPFPNTVFENHNIGQINMCGEVDYRVIIEGWKYRGSNPANQECQLHVQSTDYFATANANGSINYSLRSCLRMVPVIHTPTAPGMGIMAPMVFDLDSSNEGDQDFGIRGIYVGTYIRLYYVFPAGNAFTNNPIDMTDANAKIRIVAKPTSLYAQGELGPVRIIRWDGLANGQVIRVSGRSNVQCVAQGTIAPFTQNSSMYSDTGLNLNIFPLMHELYNGPGQVKRMWAHDEYRHMLSRLATMTSPEELANSHEKLVAAAQAAGVFETLGGTIGSLFGSGGSALGRTIGSLGDSGYHMAHKMLGNAAGVYGAQAAGMFGAQAAGMFGRDASASGMFIDEDGNVGTKRVRFSNQ